jgi:catechol 2,3-dioxygenase-like lactoylglutathione lyase family enzyme
MSQGLESMIAVTYVRDIDAARAFYELLGFRAESARQTERSAWLVLRQGEHTVLLTCTWPRLELPQLPLLFYFFFDDLEAALGVLDAAGVEVARLGHAPHAEGGEARLADPDGNTILLGQRQRSGGTSDSATESKFSLVREAAAAVAARGGSAAACQVSGPQGQPCPLAAEVRLADTAGTAIWACLAHAEDVLVTVPGAFVANEDGGGIAGFLALRHG